MRDSHKTDDNNGDVNKTCIAFKAIEYLNVPAMAIFTLLAQNTKNAK